MPIVRVVVIGGAGMVGRLLCAELAGRHDLVVLDPASQAPPEAEHVAADLTDARAPAVIAGADAVVHLAAVVPRTGVADPARVTAAFAVNVGSVHLALTLAQRHELVAFVHVSTMSVHADHGRVPVDPAAPPDAVEPYGLSKRLAEEVCRTLAARAPRPSVCSLRLAYPTPDADWPAWRRPDTGELARPTLADGTPTAALAATDLAAAVEAGLRYRGGYRAFPVVGDPGTVTGDTDDTADVLGWAPARTP